MVSYTSIVFIGVEVIKLQDKYRNVLRLPKNKINNYTLKKWKFSEIKQKGAFLILRYANVLSLINVIVKNLKKFQLLSSFFIWVKEKQRKLL